MKFHKYFGMTLGNKYLCACARHYTRLIDLQTHITQENNKKLYSF